MKPLIQRLYEEKGYVFFTQPFSMNIYGIRNAVRKSNNFDDILGVFYYNKNGVGLDFQIACTVDPGRDWLIKPMMPEYGTAAIVPGQYRRVWKRGEFKTEPALIQVGSFRLFRDNDRDDQLDYNPEQTAVWGPQAGIFLHANFQRHDPAQDVGPSSAGCVVPESRRDHINFFSRIDQQSANGLGDLYTFSLFDQKDYERA